MQLIKDIIFQRCWVQSLQSFKEFHKTRISSVWIETSAFLGKTLLLLRWKQSDNYPAAPVPMLGVREERRHDCFATRGADSPLPPQDKPGIPCLPRQVLPLHSCPSSSPQERGTLQRVSILPSTLTAANNRQHRKRDCINRENIQGYFPTPQRVACQGLLEPEAVFNGYNGFFMPCISPGPFWIM